MKQYTYRVTPEQREKIENLAKANNMKISEFTRCCMAQVVDYEK